MDDGEIIVTQTTRFPFEGKINLHLSSNIPNSPQTGLSFVAIRIPGYARNYRVIINGSFIQPEVKRGYAYLEVTGADTDITITFDMPAHFTYANPSVRADVGKTAIEKGPLVYCLEEADNGRELSGFYVNTKAPLEESFKEDLLDGTCVITAKGRKLTNQGWDEHSLYAKTPPTYEDATLTFIPYCYWGNRAPGEMAVWIKYETGGN